jgi:hypothetical protein
MLIVEYETKGKEEREREGETMKEEKRAREQKEEGKIISDRWWWM